MNVKHVSLELLVKLDERGVAEVGKFSLNFQDDTRDALGDSIDLKGLATLAQPEKVFTPALRSELLDQRATFDPQKFSVSVNVSSFATSDPYIEIERRWRIALVTFLEGYIMQSQPMLSSLKVRGAYAEQLAASNAPLH
ncbi:MULTISPECIES: hypothetical protein [Thioclava]|uniref:hypothetical protein n=1 Tax=Thioclava TaxID=285107 RepID=UPI000C59EC7A|nr:MULTISPECIES: hypothetical protein [Thioclava]MAQ36620.1 hypothetical protein [Thioclava sp.]|tara:strand:+ start:495 stop:911 length:417 start_codon:yes stop_codon:yes gene_type:complete